MELKQLKYFYDVLRFHSFTAAARHNHVSQSSVSQKIKALETEMGVSLINRNGRDFTATAAGTKLYEYANAIISASDQAVKDVRKAAAGQELPHFVIGVIASTTAWEPVAAAQIFFQRHPQSDIAVLYGTSQQLQRALLNHTIDIAFTDRSTRFADYFQTRTMLRSYVGVETAQHVLATLPSNTLMPPLEEVSASALTDVPCILPPTSTLPSVATPPSGIAAASGQSIREDASLPDPSDVGNYQSAGAISTAWAAATAAMQTHQLADGTNALVQAADAEDVSTPDGLYDRLRPQPTRAMARSAMSLELRETLGLASPVIYAATGSQAHALAAIGRGFMVRESRKPIAPHGSIIRTVPLVDKNGPVTHEYLLAALKSDALEAADEYWQILGQLIADTTTA